MEWMKNELKWIENELKWVENDQSMNAYELGLSNPDKKIENINISCYVCPKFVLQIRT